MKKILLLCCAMAYCIGLKANDSSFPEKVYDDLFVFELMDSETDLAPLYAFVEKYADVIKDGKAPIYISSYSNSMPISQINSVNAAEHAQKVKSALKAKGFSDNMFVVESVSGRYDEFYPIVIVRVGIPEGYGKEGASKYTPAITSGDVVAPGMTVAIVTEDVVSETTVKTKGPKTLIDTSLPNFNIRTNLLLWAGLTPNLGIEWRINRDFGVLARGAGTHWEWDDNYHTYRVWYAGAEVRWYLGARKRGYVGAAGHFGELHFKFNEKGYQGQFKGGSITGGYQAPIGRKLSLDFNIGVGYTRYEHDTYKFMNVTPVNRDVRVLQKKDEVYEWWGPNQVGVSLVWHITR